MELLAQWKFHTWRVARLEKYLADFVADMSNESEKRADWNIRHNLMAEYAWLTRVLGQEADFTIDTTIPLADIFSTWKKRNQEWETIMQNPPVESVTYQTSTGETYTNTIAEIVLHLIDHATYHTGQLNACLRAAGKKPVDTMYITYCRRKGSV